jgi:hypothetical protein
VATTTISPGGSFSSAEEQLRHFVASLQAARAAEKSRQPLDATEVARLVEQSYSGLQFLNKNPSWAWSSESAHEFIDVLQFLDRGRLDACTNALESLKGSVIKARLSSKLDALRSYIDKDLARIAAIAEDASSDGPDETARSDKARDLTALETLGKDLARHAEGFFNSDHTTLSRRGQHLDFRA